MATPIEWTPEQRKAFSRLFKDARARLGLTQLEVATKSGVDKGFIVSVENGPYAGMRVPDLFRAARFLGISLDEIAASLGYGEPSEDPVALTRYEPAVSALPEGERELVLRMLDTVLRGLQRR